MTENSNKTVGKHRSILAVALGLVLVQHSSALYAEIGSDLKLNREAEGSPGTISRRGLLQGAAPCSSPVRKCIIDGSPVDVQPSVYDAVNESQSCSTYFGGVLCGGYLLDVPLHAAILAGACDMACETSQLQGCPAPPAIFAHPAWAPAPAPGPACAPEPEPGCARWEYVCDAPVQYSFTERQYTLLQSAGTCTADLHPTYCFAGRSIVEVAAYHAVKGATCQKRCLDAGLIQACPASLPSTAPGPGTSPAPAAQGAFTLPNGSRPAVSDMGALPRGALFSALQTDAPPRHPSEHVPEALSSEYAGAYGGYGRRGAYGGYGGALRKPQPPPSGLAAQSLSEAQVADSDSRYLLQLGPSSECSAPCGGGTMQKPLACMDTVLGLPVEMTMCSLNRTMLGQLSEPCNTQQCSGCYWSASAWGACSADCGNGSAQRHLQCLSDGIVVSPDAPACSIGCQSALIPLAERPCAVAPCITYLWQTGLLSPGSAGYASMQHSLAGAVAARLGINSSHVVLRSINHASTPARRLRAVIDQAHDSEEFPVKAVPFSIGTAMTLPTIVPMGRSQITGRRRTLAQAPAQRQQSASLGATVWLRPPYSSGSYASLACQLGMSNASTIGSPVHIQGVQGLSKLGIGGNGKCEIGELPGPSNIGVPADCPLTFHNVPGGANGQPCSGRGAAVYAQGTCQCYTGYTGDACQTCGNGYALAGGLCQRTLESFQAQAALAGRPAQLPPAPAPAPRGLAVPKDAAASLAVPLAASLLGCLAVLALIGLVVALYVRHRRRRSRAVSAQKKGEALPVTISARAPQQVAAQTGRTQGIASMPASHTADVTVSATSKPSKCWSFFSARSTSHTSAGQVAPSSQSDSGSSVSSTSVASVRRRSAMGSMTFTHSTTHSHPSRTSLRPTYTVTHMHEAQGMVTAPSGSAYYDAPTAPERGAGAGTLERDQGRASVDSGAGAKGDLHAHAVALSDCSDMSFGGAPTSAGSSQTCIPRTGSIPEEHEVLQHAEKKT